MELLQLLAVLERQPSLVHQLLDQGGEVDHLGGQLLRPRQGVGHAQAFKGAAEILLQRDGAGGAGGDDVVDVLASRASMLSLAFCAATS